MALFERAHADWPSIAPIPGGIAVTGLYEGLDLGGPRFACGTVIFFVSWFLAGISENILIGIVAAVAGFYLLNRFELRLFGERLDVKIYPDRIELPSFSGPKLFSRELPIEFRYEQHQKAFAEEAFEHRTGKRQERKYREALEVAMQYGERRIVIAEMSQKDIDMARALVIRLQNLCAEADPTTALSAGTGAIRPATGSDFGPAPDIR